MSGYFKKPVLSVVASALGLVLLCACAGTKTTTPPGAVSASITASTSAAAAASSTATAATLPSADPRRASVQPGYGRLSHPGKHLVA